MGEKDILEGYYCYRCKEDVRCRLSTWIDGVVSLVPPHRVKIIVDARCVNCDMVLVSGEEIVELH